MKVRESKLMYIDSEINTVGNQGKAKIIVPNHQFTVYGSEQMRLTLISFEMRRSWYNINQSNNEFYLYSDAGSVFFPVVIAPGLYTKFDGGTYTAGAKGLGHAIKDALDITVTAMTVALSNTVTVTDVDYNENLRTFSFTMGGAGLPADLEVVCFHCKTGAIPPGVSAAGFFNDSYEILGAIPTRDVTQIVPAFTKDGSSDTFESPLPASLNSLEAIYLRCNLQTSNYQTNGFSRNTPDRNTMTETNILARIPLSRACFDPIFEFVQFEDSNDLFQLHLRQKTLDALSLEVTDDKGRLLAEVDPRQADLGLMSFKCTLRWDALYNYQPPHLQKSIPDGGGNLPMWIDGRSLFTNVSTTNLPM
jgi:hypothetical protein